MYDPKARMKHMGGKHSAGKGSRYRRVDLKKYNANYDKIIWHKEPNDDSQTPSDADKTAENTPHTATNDGP